MKRFLGTLTVIALSGSSAYAQQGFTADDVPRVERLEPLAAYLARPEDQIIPHYPFQRCAGVFLGYTYYAGATFDADTKQQVNSNTENLRITATYLELAHTARRLGVPIGELPEALTNDIPSKSALQMQGFAFFYADRMEANYLSDGAAFSEDPLISGDVEACGEFSQAAADFVAKLGG